MPSLRSVILSLVATVTLATDTVPVDLNSYVGRWYQM